LHENVQRLDKEVEGAKWQCDGAREEYHDAAQRGDSDGLRKHGRAWDRCEEKLDELRKLRDERKAAANQATFDYAMEQVSLMSSRELEELRRLLEARSGDA
jgi:hypothetical protein